MHVGLKTGTDDIFPFVTTLLPNYGSDIFVLFLTYLQFI
jgi:hypothetical protein